jgi:homoserine kinase
MLRWATEPVTIRVPATSANLGPGFDSLGLALTLHDSVQAAVRPAGVEVKVTGAGAGEVGRGEGHLVIRAMRAAFTAIGGQPPGLALDCRNEVPQGFGLGSSAAAIVAGLLAARELAGAAGAAALAHDELLRLATDLEGHPDNVAACLTGGLTISWITAAGVVRVARLTALPELAPVLCVPAVPLATESARLVLPEDIPHAHAAANSARAALLVAGLTGRPELLLDATEDFLHQPYRAAAMPATTALIKRLRKAGIAAVVSGAGPAALALTVAGSGPSAADVTSIAAEAGPAWRVMALGVDADGASVLPGLQDN